MRRRGFIAAGATLVAARASAQGTPATRRITVIGYLKEGGGTLNLNDRAFLAGLRDLGYVEGQNYALVLRTADGNTERLPALAAELVSMKVDIIVTGGGSPAALAAKEATSRVPIVLSNSQSPVADGIVASLARPGGNVTGLASFAPELAAKRLELATELLPGLRRVGVVWNAGNPGNSAQHRFTEDAAGMLGIELDRFALRFPSGLEEAFATASRNGAGAMLVLSDNVSATFAPQIVAYAEQYRLPGIHFSRVYMLAGGGALMCYGPIFTELFHRAASYVDKILKGANPGELPMEQPARFELVISLRAARALGLTVPPALLARADEVIE